MSRSRFGRVVLESLDWEQTREAEKFLEDIPIITEEVEMHLRCHLQGTYPNRKPTSSAIADYLDSLEMVPAA